MNVKIITINLDSDFSTMSELIDYITKELRKRLRKLPEFPKINSFQEVQLIKATRKCVIYKVRYGQVGTEGSKDGNNE